MERDMTGGSDAGGRRWFAAGVAGGVVLVGGSFVDHALLFEPFVAAARRAGRELAEGAGGNASLHFVMRFVFGFAIGLVAWIARPRLGGAVGGVALLTGLLWLLAYPTLAMQLVIFGVLPMDVAGKLMAFGFVQFAAAIGLASACAGPGRRPPSGAT